MVVINVNFKFRSGVLMPEKVIILNEQDISEIRILRNSVERLEKLAGSKRVDGEVKVQLQDQAAQMNRIIKNLLS